MLAAHFVQASVAFGIGLLIAGTVTGLMDAVANTHGERWLLRARNNIGIVFFLLTLVVTAILLIPSWIHAAFPSYGSISLAVLSAAVIVGLYTPSTTRVISFIIAPAMVFGALAALLGRSAALILHSWPSTAVLLAHAVVLAALGGGYAGYLIFALLRAPILENRASGMFRYHLIRSNLVNTLRPIWIRKLFFSFKFLIAGWVLSATVYLMSSVLGRVAWSSIVVGVIAGISAMPLIILLTVGAAFFWMNGASAILGPILLCAFFIVVRIRQGVRPIAQPVLILARFPEAICDHCLRFSRPLASIYRSGIRICEKCGGEISFKGGAGRLVAVFSDRYRARLLDRTFVQHASAIVEANRQVDVTHVFIGKDQDSFREFESLAIFLTNDPPTHGLKSIRVYADGGTKSLPQYVHNLIENNFVWTDKNPLAATKHSSPI